MLDDFFNSLFHKGNTLEAYKVFGAHLETNDHKKGVRFTVYAPNARSVQVVGDFNDWDGKTIIWKGIQMEESGLYLFLG